MNGETHPGLAEDGELDVKAGVGKAIAARAGKKWLALITPSLRVHFTQSSCLPTTEFTRVLSEQNAHHAEHGRRPGSKLPTVGNAVPREHKEKKSSPTALVPPSHGQRHSLQPSLFRGANKGDAIEKVDEKTDVDHHKGGGVEGVMHTGSRPRPKVWKATGDLGTNQSVPAHTRHTGQGWGAQST